MPGMEKFIRSRNPGESNGHWDAPHPARPATAQTTRNAHEHNGHHMYDTDTEIFDATQSSLNDQDYASDASQHGEEYDRYDEEALEIHQENGRHADVGELNKLMSQVHQDMARPRQVSPNSYPPTTSGEPDPDEISEDEVDIEHPQAHFRAEQPRDFHTTTKIPQRPVISTPLVIQPQPLHTQHFKDQFKVTTNPTISQRDVQYQNKSQSKTKAVFQPVAKHGPEQFQAAAQTAAVHKSTSHAPIEQPSQAHRQPTRAQIDHRQQRVNEADHRRQHHTRRVDHQDQLLDGFDHEEQHVTQDPPEETHEQNTHPEDLDYDLEELYLKDFAELQNEPFDGAPREDLHDTQSDLSKPLSERLASVIELDVHRQKELFSSLKLEQWEEAGDWFQERFSEVFEKLKAARKNRRKIASDFEQRIAERQQALTKKRKITDDALSEMKKSGSLVLEGTPKKKQRITE
ncbi:unnamed protein product [Aureobasidium mustum]|uniref:Extracellular mutant protein 11 C-terminal domain-containing protein n=1 Tax=Aureobasidium mustum TaxID=2773714 RepID=A0A9N8PJX2_9PEZI|nr:unnamed protein product [Aureobasidium mustum]